MCDMYCWKIYLTTSYHSKDTLTLVSFNNELEEYVDVCCYSNPSVALFFDEVKVINAGVSVHNK